MPIETDTKMTELKEFSTEELKLSTGFHPRILIQGMPGSGKTTLINTFPGQKLVIDIKGNPESLTGYKNIQVLSVKEPEADLAYGWLLAEQARKRVFELCEENPPSCIVVDTLTGLSEIAMNRVMLMDSKRSSPMGTPTQHHYMGLQMMVVRYITSLFALNCSIICIGHEDFQKNERTGAWVWLPLLTGKQRTSIPTEFTEVYGTIQKEEEGKTKYFLLTSGDEDRPHLKSTMNQMGRYWNGPQEPNLRKLLVKRFGEEEVKTLE